MVGPIPDTDLFAGRRLPHLLQGGGLFRCPACDLGFRWPRLSKMALDELYAQPADTIWRDTEAVRNDWRLAYRLLQQHLPDHSTILDVGCFDGRFLAPIRQRYACSGIEINAEAAHAASEKGIAVIGSDFSDISGQFDCITAFDVIEHVESPRSFLGQCIASVRHGGFVLISTGNLDAVSFRLSKGRYWYASIAEHISFINPKWLRQMQCQCGFEIVSLNSISHKRPTLRRRVINIAANTLHLAAPIMFRSLRKNGWGRKDARDEPALLDHPPAWETARDHIVALLRKL